MKAETNGIGTYYELHGKEGLPWLVLSHSLACSVRMWDEQIAAFKDRYRILAYDTRGHGSSDAPAGPYTLGFTCAADDDSAEIDDAITFAAPINATVTAGQTTTVEFLAPPPPS